MVYKVRFTEEAAADIVRLYEYLVEKDIAAAERALRAIESAVELLEFSPFSCRKTRTTTPFVRELIIPFGGAGYVALFEIDPGTTVTIPAVRHQREDDYQ